MKKYVYLIIWTIILFSFISRITNPAITDEVLFVSACEEIAEDWKPMMDFENTSNVRTLWHPPLYQYIVAAFISLVGNHIDTLIIFRLIQSIFFIFSAVILIGIVSNKKIFEIGKNSEFYTLLPLVLINPFILQSILLIDIDNSVLFFTITIFLKILFHKNITHKYKISLLILSFSLSLLTKMTTPLFLPIISFFYFLKNLRLFKAFVSSIIILFNGYILFTFIYYIFCEITGGDFYFTFSWIFSHLGLVEDPQITNESSRNINFLFLKIRLVDFINNIMWISLRATPYVFIAFIMFFKLRLNQRKKIEINKTTLLIFFSIIIIFIYSFIKGQVFGFNKYEGFAIAIILILVLNEFLNRKNNFVTETYNSDFLIFSVFSFFYFIYLQDPVSLASSIMTHTDGTKKLIITLFYYNLLYLIPLIIFIIYSHILKKQKINDSFVFSLTVYLLLVSSSSVAITQGFADYSTTYYHGESLSDKKEITKYLADNKHNERISYIRKDIGYYSLGAFGWVQKRFIYRDYELTKDKLVKDKPKFVLISTRNNSVRIDLFLEKYYDLFKDLNYKIIFKKNDFLLFKHDL
jgi:hypothetical protein